MPLFFEQSDAEPPPEFIGPLEKPCTLADHEWYITVEEGRAYLACRDECSEEKKRGMDTSPHGPMCEVAHEFSETAIVIGEIRVYPRIVTEHTPSTPVGPAEYDAWMELDLEPEEPEDPEGVWTGLYIGDEGVAGEPRFETCICPSREKIKINCPIHGVFRAGLAREIEKKHEAAPEIDKELAVKCMNGTCDCYLRCKLVVGEIEKRFRAAL